MTDKERNQRRSLFDVMEFARTKEEEGVTNIESKKTIVGAINFRLERKVIKEIRKAMLENGDDFSELVSGDYFVYDISEKMSEKMCRNEGCEAPATVLETRLIFAYDERDQEYELSEFRPEIRSILQSTRKRAAICEDHMQDALLRGETNDIYEEIPFGDQPAQITRLAAREKLLKGKILRPNFGAVNPDKLKSKMAKVIPLFDKDKK